MEQAGDLGGDADAVDHVEERRVVVGAEHDLLRDARIHELHHAHQLHGDLCAHLQRARALALVQVVADKAFKARFRHHRYLRF